MALIDILREAVADAANSDKRVGVVLSGGLDSSTVAMLTPTPLPAFTGYYDRPGFDERAFARLAARGDHHEILITPRDFVEHFDAMAKHVPKPYQGMGTFGQYMVAKYASEHVDILLSGEGSDELFGGYARTMLAAGEPLPRGYENYQPPSDYPVDDLVAALEYDLARLPDLLAVDDAMTAAWGIEARAPFTDQRVVDYALALYPQQRIGKRHLRQAVRGAVPNVIVDRSDKMGFPVPLVYWAQEEPVRSFIGDRLGYVPDTDTPFDRSWWYELLERAQQ